METHGVCVICPTSDQVLHHNNIRFLAMWSFIRKGDLFGLSCRAALTIYLNRNKECPHPYDCRFWDGLRERCTIRLASDTLAVEIVLNRLNRLGWPDSLIASSLGVSKSVVSKWRKGVAIPRKDRLKDMEDLEEELAAEEEEQKKWEQKWTDVLD